MENNDHTPTARITIACVCCGVAIVARDAYRRADGMVCGNCDGNENPDCPNCGKPFFSGPLD
jgi:hypothetical protein